MTKHKIPKSPPDTSKRWVPARWQIASCALALTIGPPAIFGQTATDAPASPASTTQAAPVDVSKELEAMKKRIEQLETELAANKKEKEAEKQDQAKAQAAGLTATKTATVPVTTAAASVPDAQVTTASTSPVVNVGPYANSGSFWRRWVKGEKAPHAEAV